MLDPADVINETTSQDVSQDSEQNKEHDICDDDLKVLTFSDGTFHSTTQPLNSERFFDQLIQNNKNIFVYLGDDIESYRGRIIYNDAQFITIIDLRDDEPILINKSKIVSCSSTTSGYGY